MALLDYLPVDNEVPPGTEPTIGEMFLKQLNAALMSETTWIIVGMLTLFLICKKAFTSFTEVRVRKAEARRRLSLEDEVAIGSEISRLRRARDSAEAR
jgi:hypothetical protein